jgi:hypothetical protein
MKYFLNQRISAKKKNKEWRKKMVDHYVELSYTWYDDWNRIQENYALKNNQLDRHEIANICKGLGSEEHTDVFINAYNKTHNVIDALQGEEWNRPFSYGIVNNSKRVIDRIDRDKRRDIDELAGEMFKLEAQKQQELYSIEEGKIGQSGDPQQSQQAIQELQDRYDKLYGNIVDPKTIFDKYKNITTAEEIAIHRIMTMRAAQLNLKFVKNQTFEDAIIAGREAIEIYSLHEDDLPRVKQINPLNLFFQKSPDVMWIQDSDYAGYRELMTVDKVLEDYGEFLSKAEYKRLTETGAYGGAVKGLHHPFTVTPGHKQPSEDKEVRSFRDIPRDRNGLSSEDYFALSEQYGGPDHGYMNSDYITRLGLSATNNRISNLREFIDVYTIYWKSQRRVGHYKFINEYGEEDETYVAESFSVPKRAKKDTMQDGYTKSKVVYYWTDVNDDSKKYSLEWIWIPEVWKGIRIGKDIYCQVGPVKHAYQSLLNPYDVKLPIYGYVYNNRNAYSVSIMDRMKPWQKIYYVIMARLLKLISQDRGVLTFLNIHMLDKNLGFEEALRAADDGGIIPYNPLSNSKGAGGFGNMNTMKVAERIDATNSQAIQHYITVLEFIENSIKLAAGMSDQRMAQTNARMTATDNYRDTMHSINITETLHAAHDLLWEDVLQGMMEMTLCVLSESTGKIRGFLNDEEKVLIDLDMLSLQDNFRLRVADNSKAFKILEQSKQLAHALVQNDKANLDTLIELMETENLSEFKHLVREAEEKNQQRQEQQQQSQQDHEKEIAEMQRKQNEDNQIAKLDEINLKGKLDFEREKMKAELQAASFDPEKDYNRDGIADYLQQEQLQQKIDNESRKIDLDEFKIGMEQRKVEQDQLNKLNDSAMQAEENELDRQETATANAQKSKLEAMKIKAMKDKKSK